MERVLSGRPGTSRRDTEHPGDGSDSPAWSRTRAEYEARVRRPEGPVVPYAELHTHSAFSFLDGASTPEELAEEAARLGLEALAVTDHDGLYGAVRFAEAARELDIRTVFGAELGLDDAHLLVLARGQEAIDACRGRSPTPTSQEGRRTTRRTTTTRSPTPPVGTGRSSPVVVGGTCDKRSPRAGSPPPKRHCSISSTGSVPTA